MRYSFLRFLYRQWMYGMHNFIQRVSETPKTFVRNPPLRNSMTVNSHKLSLDRFCCSSRLQRTICSIYLGFSFLVLLYSVQSNDLSQFAVNYFELGILSITIPITGSGNIPKKMNCVRCSFDKAIQLNTYVYCLCWFDDL